LATFEENLNQFHRVYSHVICTTLEGTTVKQRSNECETTNMKQQQTNQTNQTNQPNPTQPKQAPAPAWTYSPELPQQKQELSFIKTTTSSFHSLFFIRFYLC